MAAKYAKDQPAGFSNRIERVAIVGAAGSLGKYITGELLKTGKHTLTALTRAGSDSTFPPGVGVATVDYADEDSLVRAMQGQQFVILALNRTVSPATHADLVRAAAKAGVPYVMPNCHGADPLSESLCRDTMIGDVFRQNIADVEAAGVSKWITLTCGTWYEFSLMMPAEWYGFDHENKVMTFYDDGTERIDTTTWAQCGRAVAALLSLRELPEDEHDAAPAVSNWADKPLYVSSFLVSQRDMFDSYKRVTGGADGWTTRSEPSKERYARGLERFAKGDLLGFAQAMYARSFYPTGESNYRDRCGLANEALGLPVEDIDEATKFAKELVDKRLSGIIKMI